MLNVKAGKFYRNIKTRRVYKVLYIARSAWDIEQRLVIYGMSEHPESFPWARSLNEFRENFESLDCFSCSNTASDPWAGEDGDIIHCMIHGEKIFDENDHCKDWKRKEAQ